MKKIQSFAIRRGAKEIPCNRGIISIGTGQEAEMRFDRAWYPHMLPLHACLKKGSTSVEVVRLTPGAEVFFNGALLPDNAKVTESCVLEFGRHGPVIHLDFHDVPLSWSDIGTILLKIAGVSKVIVNVSHGVSGIVQIFDVVTEAVS